MSAPFPRLRTALLLATVLAAGGAGCSAPASLDPYGKSLAEGLTHLEEDEPAAAMRDMDRLLAELPHESPSHDLLRFHAESLAARAHTAASLGPAFQLEVTNTGSHVGGIGQGGPAPPVVRRPSTTAHLVAAVYHASQARELFPRAARAAPRQDLTFLPAPFTARSIEDEDARLQVLLTVAYARLGFREEVDAILAHSPELLDLETCFAALDRYGIPDELRPFVCEMVFHHLRTRDERLAYRFAILAVEGDERFHHALPAEAIARIDHWIVHEAHLFFVCPESQTPYLPGARRSPISGLPHFDYIAVERPAGER